MFSLELTFAIFVGRTGLLKNVVRTSDADACFQNVNMCSEFFVAHDKISAISIYLSIHFFPDMLVSECLRETTIFNLQSISMS